MVGWSTGLSWSGYGDGGVVHGGVVDGSVMEWIGRGGSTWWGGRRVCHGVDMGMGEYMVGWSTGLSWSGYGDGGVHGGVVDGSVMEWIGRGGSTWRGGRRVCHGVDRGMGG